MRKRMTVIAMSMLLALGVVGCEGYNEGPNQPPPPAPTAPAPDEPADDM